MSILQVPSLTLSSKNQRDFYDLGKTIWKLKFSFLSCPEEAKYWRVRVSGRKQKESFNRKSASERGHCELPMLYLTFTAESQISHWMR